MVAKLSITFLTCIAVFAMAANAYADNHIEVAGTPEEIADRLDELSGQRSNAATNEFHEIWDSLDPETQREVDDIRKERLEAQFAADRQFDRDLKGLHGDEWAAYTAAFLSATLFEVDKPFEQAFGENLQALGNQTGETVDELVDNMNEQVRAERQAVADAEQARLDAVAAAQQEHLEGIGDVVLEGYDQATDKFVIGSGFGDYATSTAVNRSAVMVQDAFVGNNMQLRYQLNTLKTAEGDIPEGNFVTQPGYEVYDTVKGSLREIGQLEADDADDDLIDAKKGELTNFLSLTGMEGTEEHLTRRIEFTDLLTGYSQDAVSKYSLYYRIDNMIRVKKVSRQFFQTGNMPRYGEERGPFLAELAARDHEIEGLENQLAALNQEQTELDFMTSLNQSPFLSAPIEVDGFSGPYYQYLAGPIHGYHPTNDISHRSPEKDEQALDQAINFLDGVTMEVAFEYGTIVNGEIMIRTFGGPSFNALRDQIVVELGPMIPHTGIWMGELETVFQAEWADTEFSRVAWDVGTGMVAIVIAGTIFLFPPTAVVLVPVELTLMGTQIAVEGGRLVGAYQDYSAAETLVQAGSGDRTALTRYGDVLDAQTSTFILTTGLNIVGAGGSVAALDDAVKALKTADDAASAVASAGGAVDDAARGSDSAAAGLDDTQIFRPGTFDPAPPGNIIDADTFQEMTTAQRAAALDDLPESVQVSLANQLSHADQKALAIARVNHAIVQGIRESPGTVIVMQGNTRIPLSAEAGAARIAEMTDQEIVWAIKTDGIKISEDSLATLLAGPGDDLLGPFSAVRGADEAASELGFDVPAPGYWFAADSSQQQIDDLFNIDVSGLTRAETNAVNLQRSDAIRQGMRPSSMSEDAYRGMVETHIINSQNKLKDALTNDELRRAGWRPEWGDAPEYIKPPTPKPAAAADDSWGLGGRAMDDGDSTVRSAAGGLDDGDSTLGGVPRGMENAPIDQGIPGWNAPLRVQPQPQPSMNMDEILGNQPFWVDMPQTPGLGANIAGRYLGGQPGYNSLVNRLLRQPQGAPVGAGTVLDEGSTIIHLRPRWWEMSSGNGSAWRNFLFRAFTVGACNDEWLPECENDTPIGVLRVPAGQEDEVAAAIAGDPRVAFAEPNSSRTSLAEVNDPLYESNGAQPHADQWALKNIGLTAENEDWPVSENPGDGIIIAVIDTGLAWSHPDFDPDSLWINGSEIPANYVDDDMNGYVDDIVGWNFLDHKPAPWDFDGHGTFVASIIAANTNNETGIAGINSGVRIMPLKAVDNFGRSRASYLAEAIIYAANNGARIINLSVGGGKLTRTEQMAIDYAAARDVLIIAGAGNEGQQLDGYGPAGAKRVLTVAASDTKDRRMSFSNWGPQVDLTAPGQDIVGLRAPATDLMVNASNSNYQPGRNYVGDDQLYYRATGTSFAAPIVSGVASLVWSNDPSLSAVEVRRILEQTARDIEPPGRDDYSGYGIVNARGALLSKPEFYILAEIDNARPVSENGQTFLQVSGIADADEFSYARLQIGQGENPEAWIPVGDPIMNPQRATEIGRIPAEMFAGSNVWTIRLVVNHQNTLTRDTTYVVDLVK